MEWNGFFSILNSISKMALSNQNVIVKGGAMQYWCCSFITYPAYTQIIVANHICLFGKK